MMKDFEYKDYFNARLCFAGDEIKLAAVLDSYVQNQTDLNDINKILELYNTKVFFEKVPEISLWSDEKYNSYKEIADNVVKEVKKFFDTISENNIVDIYENCHVSFRDDFWKFLCKFKVYERISKLNVISVIKQMGVNPYVFLSNKKFVEYFDCELTDLLKEPEYSARLLVDFYLEKRNKPLKIYFPKSLTPEIKYQIISDYISEEHVNANLLNLIINGKGTKDFPIDDKLRYKAKKTYERIWENPNMHMISHQMGISVSFGPNLPDKTVKIEGGNIIAEYNVNWVRDNTDYSTLLNNFIYLFEYTDLHMRCNLTSMKSQRGALADIFIVDGKTMYKYGHSFTVLNDLANAQMGCYKDVLEKDNIYIEDIIKWFFEIYLKEEYYAEGFVCVTPKHSDSLLSKYERLASVMDGVTKQFKLFCEEGEIDRGLYEMSSGSIRFKDIPSFVKNKYCYSNSSELNREMNAVFSDQSTLSYTERTKAQYNTFYDLIIKEDITIDDMEPYNKDDIEWLMLRGTIVLEEGIIRFNPERLLILYEFYYKEVICLQYVKSDVLKQLIKNGEVEVESSLLSMSESQYFDYNLNKAEFTNGLDLRNKYIHDTGSLDENIQYQDYLALLKLMIILIIKINEEFCLRDRLKEGEGDFYEL